MSPTDTTDMNGAGTSARPGHFQASWKRLTVACGVFLAIVMLLDQGLDHLLGLGVPADYRVFLAGCGKIHLSGPFPRLPASFEGACAGLR
ncbi:hypothetical protein, partial [Tistrella bauzanensis]